MNRIIVREANTPALMKDYVMFPFKLYENHPYWVPPLINDELETLDKNKNPAFDGAEAKFYLAYIGKEIVGRMAAIINRDEIKLLNKHKIRFGWWDVIDNVDVTKALLDKVIEWGRKEKLENIEGPMGFSNLDKVGVISEGYDFMGSMITWYNYPYYITHLETLGLVKEKEYHESWFSFSSVDTKYFERAAEFIAKRYQLKGVRFTKTIDILPYVDDMFELFNTTYAKLASFVPINEKQIEYYKKKYIPFINPEYIKFILDKDDNMIAFSIVMPGFSEALKKSKGRLFPFGFYHLLKARKNSKEVLFYLIGVDPEYQNKGVTALIMKEYYEVFVRKGIETCVRTPELEENHAIHNLWKNFDSRVLRKRRTYRLDL